MDCEVNDVYVSIVVQRIIQFNVGHARKEKKKKKNFSKLFSMFSSFMWCLSTTNRSNNDGRVLYPFSSFRLLLF